jgi:hypothetical protein
MNHCKNKIFKVNKKFIFLAQNLPNNNKLTWIK